VSGSVECSETASSNSSAHLEEFQVQELFRQNSRSKRRNESKLPSQAPEAWSCCWYFQVVEPEVEWCSHDLRDKSERVEVTRHDAYLKLYPDSDCQVGPVILQVLPQCICPTALPVPLAANLVFTLLVVRTLLKSPLSWNCASMERCEMYALWTHRRGC